MGGATQLFMVIFQSDSYTKRVSTKGTLDMKKLLATAGVALMTLTPTTAYAADHTPAPEAVHCVTSDGVPVPCTTSPVPLSPASTYPPSPVEQKTKPAETSTASEAAVIVILSLLFAAATITVGWCSGRFGNN